MFRALTIIAAVVALAVFAAPASAKMHLDDISLGVTTDDAKSSTTPKAWWSPRGR